MTSRQKKLLFCIAFPIVILLGVTLQKHSLRQTGVKMTFPISGYDPRDLLSGHYLIYTVDYGIPEVCANPHALPTSPEAVSYICFDTSSFQTGPKNHNCKVFIRGECKYGRFVAGLERFYVPQEKALPLEKLIQSKKASIEVAIGSDGSAQVTDLLIEGVTWQEALTKAEALAPQAPNQ